METTHKVLIRNAAKLDAIESGSIDLMVTSPPYPMIQMWDDLFVSQDIRIEKALKTGQGQKAFEFMHQMLDPVWDEVFRVLKQGGFACINIGDATRTLDSDFAIYSNHTRILQHLLKIGFTVLPAIIWRKQTNAPNKFMGSGMLPAGAYVTLEHEYILIVRKGGKREFKTEEEKLHRHQSALFWEERNSFYSDVWFDIKGSRQDLHDKDLRKRSAAYPFELAYRLINMYSVKNDTILDPFAGTGTTLAASMTAARNSIVCEIDPSFLTPITGIEHTILSFARETVFTRLNDHLSFVRQRISQDKPLKYLNKPYGFPVMTRQETELMINELTGVKKISKNLLRAFYSDIPQPGFPLQENQHPLSCPDGKTKKKHQKPASVQLELF